MYSEGKIHLRAAQFFEALGNKQPVFWEDSWVISYGSYLLEIHEDVEAEKDWCITLHYGDEEVVRFYTNILNASVGLDVHVVVKAFIQDIHDELKDKIYKVCGYIEDNFGCTLTPVNAFSSKKNKGLTEEKRWKGKGEYEGVRYYIEVFITPKHNPVLALSNVQTQTKIYHEITRDDTHYKTKIVDFFDGLSSS